MDNKILTFNISEGESHALRLIHNRCVQCNNHFYAVEKYTPYCCRACAISHRDLKVGIPINLSNSMSIGVTNYPNNLTHSDIMNSYDKLIFDELMKKSTIANLISATATTVPAPTSTPKSITVVKDPVFKTLHRFGK